MEKLIRWIWAFHPAGTTFLASRSELGWREVPCVDRRVHRWKDHSPSSGTDQYFTPHAFDGLRRRRSEALPTRWLHADLDEVNPRMVRPLPTVLWETSRGRYQCLWLLDREVGVDEMEALNQRLSYLNEADKNGWSITKVLRVVGTRNYKYGGYEGYDGVGEENRFEVRLRVLKRDRLYAPEMIRELVKNVVLSGSSSRGGSSEWGNGDEREKPLAELSDVKRTMRRFKVKPNVRQLVVAKTAVEGQRSDKLWQIACGLSESGMGVELIARVMRQTVWNKYSGQRREHTQLRREARKAYERVAAKGAGRNGKTGTDRERGGDGKKGESKRGSERGGEGGSGSAAEEDDGVIVGDLLKVSDLKRFDKFLGLDLPPERWLVSDIWTSSAHGFIAGEAKTYKSLIATDLAISVATGTQFLGEFDVPHEVGPVIIIQEENKPETFQDRCARIAHSRGLGGKVHNDGTLEMPRNVPVYLLNNRGFKLTNRDHIKFLERAIRKIRPKLVVLDPLYLMAPELNESEQQAMSPVMNVLLRLKQRYGVGILLVHHFNKPREEETRHPGNRISGTSVFYRWLESTVYLEKVRNSAKVVLSAEHRTQPPGSKVFLDFDLGGPDNLDYFVDVKVKATVPVTMRSQLKQWVEEAHGAGKGVRVDEAMARFDVSRRFVDNVVAALGSLVIEDARDGDHDKAGRPPKMIYMVDKVVR